MRRILLLLVAVLVISLFSVQAQVPRKVSYQGLLTTSLGTPVQNGTYNLKFDIYDLPTGGTLRYTETQTGVILGRGTFSVVLRPPSSVFSESLFVEVTALTGPGILSPLTFSPRAELTTAPYAFRADTAAFAQTASSSPPSGTAGGALIGSYPNPSIANNVVTGAMILDSTITGADINTNSNLNIATVTTNGLSVSSNASITGNVGIGTNSPVAKLQVSGGDVMLGGASLHTNSPQEFFWTIHGQDYRWRDSSVTFYGNSYKLEHFGSGDFVINKPNGGNIDILTSGKFGIGTTSSFGKVTVSADGNSTLVNNPNSSLTLVRQGYHTLLMERRTVHTGALFCGENSFGMGDDGMDLQFRTDVSVVGDPSTTGDLRMIIKTNGNVGIGDSTPAYKLDVNGIVNAMDFYKNGLPFSGGGSQWTTSGSNIYYNSGNVGVGTTSPIARLHVVGDLNTVFLQPNSNNTASGITLNSKMSSGLNWNVAQVIGILPTDDPTTARLGFNIINTSGSGYGEALSIRSGGNIGIGTTSPLVGLMVESDNGSGYTSWYRTNSSASGVGIGTFSGKGGIQGLTSAGNADVLSLNSAGGNVGIGTTTPSEKLEVAGNIKIGNATIRSGTGDPTGVVTGNVGDLYLRTDGGAGTTLYVKESGSATNTGWVGK